MSAPLPFVSAAELRNSTPVEPDWLWQGYVAPGALTLLAAKPKAGKSTLALALAEAMVTGAGSFLGRPLASGHVVYVSEEAPGTLAHKLPEQQAIRVLTRDAVWPKPEWRELVTGSVQECLRVGAGLLVIDTWSYWAGLPKEAEKDAGAAQEAMQPLLDATREGLALLVLVHGRKGGGEDGEGVRGSTAIAGAADIVLELERPEKGGNPHERALLALSRYPSTPGSLLIERDHATGAWRGIAEGDRGDSRALLDRQRLLALLDGAPYTRDELVDAMGSPQRQWHGPLEALIGEGVVQRTGAGKRGSPYGYELVRGDAAQTPAQDCAETPRGGGSFSAALSVGEQQKEPAPAGTPNAAHCAAPLAADVGRGPDAPTDAPTLADSLIPLADGDEPGTPSAYDPTSEWA
jgi:hypothetical protein